MLQRILLLIVISTIAVSTALAQRFELQPFVGYKFGGNVPVGQNDFDFAKVNFQSSINYGVSFAYNASENIGFEFLWNRQPTNAVGVLGGGGTFPEKVDVNIDQFHGNVVITMRDEDEKLRPFFLFGAGATRGEGRGSSTSRFSFGVGGGVKYFFTEKMGVRLQARYAPTYLYSEPGGLWCNWWGFCWVLPNDKYVQQGDLTAGWIFRF